MITIVSFKNDNVVVIVVFLTNRVCNILSTIFFLFHCLACKIHMRSSVRAHCLLYEFQMQKITNKKSLQRLRLRNVNSYKLQCYRKIEVIPSYDSAQSTVS